VNEDELAGKKEAEIPMLEAREKVFRKEIFRGRHAPAAGLVISSRDVRGLDVSDDHLKTRHRLAAETATFAN